MFILKLKILNVLFVFLLELSDALVAVEYGSNRTDEFQSVVTHNINYLASNAHG